MKLLKLYLIFIIITGLFYSCEEMTPPLSPEPTPESTPEPIIDQPTFVEFQGIATNCGFDYEYFSIGENHFLAVANDYNGTSYNINSHIYKWNGYTFSLHQSIATNGALHWESFSIEGNYYLAVANHNNGSTYNLNSRIYRWDTATELFVSYQTIGTNGAYDWEFFSIGDDHFLVVAQYYNDSTRNINSVLYKWNGVNFALYQTIATNGAVGWEYFSIEDNHFLAVANHHNNSTYNIDSRIYKWNTSTKLFDLFQAIATNAAWDWEYFCINGSHYIAVANSYSGTTYNINSRIYKWNTDTESFNLFQAIPTNNARHWEHFLVGDSHFLGIANGQDDETCNITSTIYNWDINTEQFNSCDVIETSGARDLEDFIIGDDLFLAVINSYNDTTYNINSMIYKITY